MEGSSRRSKGSSGSSWCEIASARKSTNDRYHDDWSLSLMDGAGSASSWSFVLPDTKSSKSSSIASKEQQNQVPPPSQSHSRAITVAADDDETLSNLSLSVASTSIRPDSKSKEGSGSAHRTTATLTSFPYDDYDRLGLLHPMDDFSHRKAPRTGKKSLKHSLVRRCDYYLPSSQQDRIEVSRKGAQRHGLCPKSVVDEFLPELLHFQACGRRTGQTTMGNSHRWETVPALLEHLEATGKATRVRYNPSQATCEGSYIIPYGRYSDPPMERRTFSVPANGYSPPSESHSENYDTISTTAVYTWSRGKPRILCELSSQPPPEVCSTKQLLRQCYPLKGKLKAIRGNQPLDGRTRKAFVPGVSAVCGGAPCTNIPAVQNNVVEGGVDLVFDHPVMVRYASVAGKIHDTHQQWTCLSKKQDNQPVKYYQNKIVPPREKKFPGAYVHIAAEGTESYCDRVSIDGRLVDDNTGSRSINREWVHLGVYDTCSDGHTETAIALGASRCTALRFRAVSWRGNKPMLRVGAYGQSSMIGKSNHSKNTASSSLPAAVDESDDTILYTLHRLEKRQDGRNPPKVCYQISSAVRFLDPSGSKTHQEERQKGYKKVHKGCSKW